MKMLKKLALVSAVSMISAGSFAMEAMDDESLATTVGQDGITIMISPGGKTGTQLAALGVSDAAMAAIDALGTINNGATQGVGTNTAFKGLSINQVVIHDDDGVGAGLGFAANLNSGSLVIGDGTAPDSTVVFADDALPIIIDLDMVGDTSATAGNQSMLNVKISTPTLAIKMGAVYVSNSNASANGIDKDGGALAQAEVNGTSQDTGTGIKIANAMEVILGATTINIQLGSEVQTVGGISSMILVNASLLGGLSINNSSLIDAGGAITGGQINMGSLKITDAGGSNLTAIVGVNVENDLTQLAALNGGVYTGPAAAEGGLVVTLFQLGTAANGIDVAINNTTLGAATVANGGTNTSDLGDVQILGLQLAGTSLIIRGH